jgi:hypothetical protein
MEKFSRNDAVTKNMSGMTCLPIKAAT